MRRGFSAVKGRGWWAKLPVLLHMAGCAAQPAAKPVSVSVAEAPEREDDAAPLAPARAGVGCIVTETTIDGQVELRFELGGEPLAILRDAEVRLALNAEPRTLELERGGVMLRTPFDPKERPLHLRRAVALGGVVTPKPHAEIVALDQAPAGQRVRFTTGFELGQAALEDAVACADICLNTYDYEVDAEEEAEGRPVQLRGTVGVSSAPGDQASLELPARDILADELERRAGFVKIRVDTADELLLGWVPESAITEVVRGRGGGGSGSGLGFAHRGTPAHVRYTACGRELTLFAEREGRVGEVGLVRPETRFELVGSIERGPQAGFSVIEFWQRWIFPRQGVRLLVPSDDLGGCATQ